MNGYVTNPNNWKVTYTIEYIDDKKVWDKLEQYTNPWEHYKVKEFDNLSDAITLYSLWQIQDNIYDCKLFIRMETPDGNWYEEYVAFDSTYKYSLRHRVDDEMRKRMEEAEKTNIELAKQNEAMAEFLRKYGVNPYDVIKEVAV